MIKFSKPITIKETKEKINRALTEREKYLAMIRILYATATIYMFKPLKEIK